MGTETISVGRPRDPDATQAILSHTLRLLAERGYVGMSTADVAAAARASKATVYRRWPSKFALVAAAIQHGLRLAASPAPTSGDPREDIVLLIAGKMTALADGPLGGAIRAVVSHAAHEPELSAALRAMTDHEREHGPLRPLVEQLAPGRDIDLMLDLLLGLPFFQLLIRQTPPDPAQARALVAQVLPPAAP